MSSVTPAAAIEAKLRADYTDADIFTANELDQPPQQGTPFVVLEFPGGTAEQITVGAPGNNVFRERGAFMTHVMVPAASGAAVARQMADDIAAIFRGQTFSGVRCQAPFPPQEDTGPDGNWFGVSFSTAFTWDRFA